MNFKAFALIFSLSVFFSAANSFNITKILSKASDFSSFNDLLTQTGLAEKINSRSTITVLALDEGSIDALQGKTKDEVRNILSNHVILDYYDIQKLKKLSNESSTLTTLFQASGLAHMGQGFLTVTRTSSGDVDFGSGVKDAPSSAMAVKSVFSEPYNISVIQISQAIIAPGIDAASPESANPQAPSWSPAISKGSKKAPSQSSTDSDHSEAPTTVTKESASALEESPLNNSGNVDEETAEPATPPVDSDVSNAVGLGGGVAVLTGLVLTIVGF